MSVPRVTSPSSTISALPPTKDSLVFFQVGRFIEFYGPQRFLAVRTLGLRSAAIAHAGYAFTAGFPTHLSGLYASRANKKGSSVLEVRQLSAPIQQGCPPRVPGSVLMPNGGTESRKGFFTLPRFFTGQLTQLLIISSIVKLEFESDAAKAAANLQVHGVSFELAKTVFKDPFAIEFLDDREDYGEERFVIIGMAEGQVLLFVAYTERVERIRIISARRATKNEQDQYFRQNA